MSPEAEASGKTQKSRESDRGNALGLKQLRVTALNGKLIIDIKAVNN